MENIMKYRPDYLKEVKPLQGSVQIEHTLAKRGAKKLRGMLDRGELIRTLGAYNAQQAINFAKGGLDSIYISGWQVAAANNTAENMYPDQGIYPANSVPTVIKNINNGFRRADQIQAFTGKGDIDYFLPIVADAEAGFGGILNAYELMYQMIEAGAAGAHFEDQVSAEKKCGHMGGKVLIPTQQMIRMLKSARLAAEVAGVDIVLIARTDAESAKLVSSDIDPADAEFLTGERSIEGYYYIKNGIDACIKRALAYAPYADLLWFETSTPDYDQAKKFAKAIHEVYPKQKFAYNCSPSFNWHAALSSQECDEFQDKLAELGYVFQHVTLAGFHCTNLASFELAESYVKRGMGAYADFQNKEFLAAERGFTSVKHQAEVGTEVFDFINTCVGTGTTNAMIESTEAAQF